jgi:ribonuclease Y
MDTLLIGLISLLIGGGGGYVIKNVLETRNLNSNRHTATKLIQDSESQAKQLLLEAKVEGSQLRTSAESQIREQRQEVQRQERRITGREEGIERRQLSLEEKETRLNEREGSIDTHLDEIEAIKQQQLQALETASGLTVSDARDEIMQLAQGEMENELTKRYYDLEQQMLADADDKAKKAIALSIQRLAADVVAETTTALVSLPSDEMKGRLIGREGRNIRAIEAATGVDMIIDDTPEAITISCFDPIRREVARISLEGLIQDGRIHPARIEEMVEKAQKEVDDTIRRQGEQAILDADVRGLHPELIKLLGRLHYRYSYGENVLQHSVEVAQLAGMLAGEIRANTQVAKAGGLLHDIGKALTHEVEGSHIEIGDEVARRYGLSDAVKSAIAEHHDDDRGSPEAFLVAAADAMSAARPGARRDTSEFYVKRLEALEDVANSFDGVEKSFAIQAGREVRILVQPDEIDDVGAANLARNVVKKIEENLVYPGQIKVTVVRETRASEYAS